ncbi:hypothetical protein [Salegentibacter sp. F14]
MKALLYKILLAVVLIPGLTFCNNDLSGKHTKEKKISREFSVAANSNLQVDNSYGNVDISTWDQNRVVIEVFIKTNGNDPEKVQEKLDEIEVEFNQNASGVSAKTDISRNTGSSWWSKLFSGSSNVNMEINYVIKAPETNNMELNNDYGGIYIDRLLGNSRISCDYGKIDILELRGDSNYLNFDYTRNSRFGYIKNAEINADYSEFEIEEAQRLKINADYTTSKINKVSNLEFSADYGSITVEKVKRIIGDGDYLSTKIGRVFTAADLKVDYGNLSITKMVTGAKSIKINSDYAGIKIGYDANQPFNFNIEASYGNIQGLDDLQVQKRHEENTSKSLQGYHLENNSGNQVSINSSYANVHFSKK